MKKKHRLAIKIGLFVIALLFPMICVASQTVEVRGNRIPLREGNIVGAAFYDEKSIFFVLQSVLSTGPEGHGLRSHLELSSWNSDTSAAIMERRFPPGTPGQSVMPCGRMEVSTSRRRLFICSSDTALEELDVDTLQTMTVVALKQDEPILDFAIDEGRSRVLVLRKLANGSILLVSYSLHDGAKQQETVLATAQGTNAILATSPSSDTVGIAVNVSKHRRYVAQILSCHEDRVLSCSKISETEAVAQIATYDKQLLIATNTFADNTRDCVKAIDLLSGEAAPGYCARDGVHYAVGVAAGAYVVGFTGIAKRDWLSEENRSVVSGFSVWSRADRSILGSVTDKTEYGSFQDQIRIVASRTKPLFLGYHRLSNSLTLYVIAHRSN